MNTNQNTNRYAYYYAIIEEDGFCVEVQDTTNYIVRSTFIPIPEYNEDYLEKYYNRADQKWYWDEDFTEEWIPE